MTKIAIATEDGVHVSAHFGRAPFFQVVTVENGKIVSSERRDKNYHGGEHTNEPHDHAGHDHNGMISAAHDCVAIIAGGMGSPAYASIESAGLKPILTDEREVEKAALGYASGTLVNRMDRVHRH
jgi:predicted Fe-Mo cluster-binding NifX family protein